MRKKPFIQKQKDKSFIWLYLMNMFIKIKFLIRIETRIKFIKKNKRKKNTMQYYTY
jgi:hypothetical protein